MTRFSKTLLRRAATAALLLGTVIAGEAPAGAAPSPIAGRWITADGSGLVVIAPCGAQICGRIAQVLRNQSGATGRDANNPDPALRARPILGLPILTGFVAGDHDWRGRIYDPRSGKTYKSIVTRAADGTLKVQGCIAFFCQGQIWRPAR